MRKCDEKFRERIREEDRLNLRKSYLNLTGKPVKTPAGLMWNLGDYEGKSSIRYFEFVGFPYHVHVGCDETFYVLGGIGEFGCCSVIPSDAGTLGFLLAERLYTEKVRKGSVIYVRRGEAHSLAVPTGLTLDTLLITIPKYNPKDEFSVKCKKK